MFQHSTFSSIVIAASICSIATVSSLTLAQGAARAEPTEAVQSATIEIAYDPDTTAEVTPTQRARAQTILDATYAAAASLLPDLPDHVNVTVALLDRDLRSVGDVTGRADAPGAITIQISSQAEGGIDGAIEQGLEKTFAHELHHLARGWTIEGNRFGPGISIAAVNEGLAVVFAEELTGQSTPGDTPPADDVAEAWAAEILALPRYANYQTWMFDHPDGRKAVGYRTGNFIVRRAMANSGLDIVELTEKSPDEIWELAGF